ncbi:hypothetical protein [Geopsychrobacter electrodiphilus]|uniref:hypothetical protein n=1 Tax=Geopsychrobacter electrodiphilus TaxID=225196 RepID=UPI0012EC29F1|nr:hypothetical protein [Geopsychrobacter electrodiphilus]
MHYSARVLPQLIAFYVSDCLTLPIQALTRVVDLFRQGKLNLKISDFIRKDASTALCERQGASILMAIERLQSRKPVKKNPTGCCSGSFYAHGRFSMEKVSRLWLNPGPEYLQ